MKLYSIAIKIHFILDLNNNFAKTLSSFQSVHGEKNMLSDIIKVFIYICRMKYCTMNTTIKYIECVYCIQYNATLT